MATYVGCVFSKMTRGIPNEGEQWRLATSEIISYEENEILHKTFFVLGPNQFRPREKFLSKKGKRKKKLQRFYIKVDKEIDFLKLENCWLAHQRWKVTECTDRGMIKLKLSVKREWIFLN